MSTIDKQILSLKERIKTLEEARKKKIQEAKIAQKQRARKIENQRKFELGGLVKLAGLFETDKGILLGALIQAKAALQHPDNQRRFKLIGDQALANHEREKKTQDEKNEDLQTN